MHFRFTWFWIFEHTSNMSGLIDCLMNWLIKLILTVARHVQKNRDCVRNCHCHLDSMCDIAIVCIARMFRRSARIAARSLPYEATTTTTVGSVEDDTSSDAHEQESVINFDLFAFAKLPRHKTAVRILPWQFSKGERIKMNYRLLFIFIA